jgi:hypothetical protein
MRVLQPVGGGGGGGLVTVSASGQCARLCCGA